MRELQVYYHTCNWVRKGEGERRENHLNKYGQNLSRYDEKDEPVYLRNAMNPSTKLHKINYIMVHDNQISENQ